MKKIFVIALVFVLLAVTTVPALAADRTQIRNGHAAGVDFRKVGKMPFALAGTIASLDPVARTITVNVACGNILVKPYIGQDLILQTIGTTRFLLRNPNGTATPITFEDLAIGQNVSSQGNIGDNKWTTSRITVGAELNCLP